MKPSGFGGRLKELRTRAGLTQPQLADRAGVSKATVADLEQGRYEPSWPMLLALAGALGAALDDFRCGPAAPRAGRGRPRKGPGGPTGPRGIPWGGESRPAAAPARRGRRAEGDRSGPLPLPG